MKTAMFLVEKDFTALRARSLSEQNASALETVQVVICCLVFRATGRD